MIYSLGHRNPTFGREREREREKEREREREGDKKIGEKTKREEGIETDRLVEIEILYLDRDCLREIEWERKLEREREREKERESERERERKREQMKSNFLNFHK